VTTVLALSSVQSSVGVKDRNRTGTKPGQRPGKARAASRNPRLFTWLRIAALLKRRGRDSNLFTCLCENRRFQPRRRKIRRTGPRIPGHRPWLGCAHRRLAQAARGDPRRHPGNGPGGGRVASVAGVSTPSTSTEPPQTLAKARFRGHEPGPGSGRSSRGIHSGVVEVSGAIALR